MVIKFLISFLIFLSFAFAEDKCLLDKKILYSIILNEGLKNKIGYEYIISFNNLSDSKRVRQTKLKSYFLNDRVLDCKNQFLCEVILEKLSGAGIKNLDVGAFQINYSYHKLPISNYFKIDESYKYACNFIHSNIKKYGYNWYAIATYHSATPYYNQKYQRNLIKNYNLVSSKLN